MFEWEGYTWLSLPNFGDCFDSKVDSLWTMESECHFSAVFSAWTHTHTQRHKVLQGYGSSQVYELQDRTINTGRTGNSADWQWPISAEMSHISLKTIDLHSTHPQFCEQHLALTFASSVWYSCLWQPNPCRVGLPLFRCPSISPCPKSFAYCLFDSVDVTESISFHILRSISLSLDLGVLSLANHKSTNQPQPQ